MSAAGADHQLGEAGRELVDRYGVPFLVKGGHLRGVEAVDLLVVGLARTLAMPSKFIVPVVPIAPLPTEVVPPFRLIVPE